MNRFTIIILFGYLNAQPGILKVGFDIDDTVLYSEPIFQYYKKAVNELLRDEKIKFIDTEKNLEIIKKQNLFCDDVHQTLIGNKLTAKIIFEYQMD